MKKDFVFVCQISDDTCRIVKCLAQAGPRRQIADLEKTKLPGLAQALKKLGYNRHPIIVSLPRAQATARYIKIPSQSTHEIEKIIALQASRYLPYPAQELITAYQIISTDKEGYAHVNLIIAHKDAIQRYLDILRPLAPSEIKIILSSYGLLNLYTWAAQNKNEACVLINMEESQAEFAVIEEEKLLFSRVFNFSRDRQGWQQAVAEEINKSKDACLKELNRTAPIKTLTAQDILKNDFPQALQDKILATDSGFIALAGLALKELPESLNLAPPELKQAAKKMARRSELLRYAGLIIAIIIIFGLGLSRSLSNKEAYLQKIKAELDKVSQEARPLEEIERRVRAIEGRSRRPLSSLDMLYEISKLLPRELSLTGINYEESRQFILRGQAAELKPIFEFASQLKDSAVFKSFNIRVRYATKRAGTAAEVIDFEIVCLKK
jgi:hypothetical protein